ncbi:hypothetical protein [Roseivivax isoporae]|nr:hypothetical protein [Roseivivax isoporae]
MGLIELRVREDARDILVYTFRTIAEASEMIHFLAEFFPGAQYVVQPGRH